MQLSRPIGNFDRCAITPTLDSAVLNFSYVRHRPKQPDSRSYQHDQKTEHHRILDGAIAPFLRRLRRGPSPFRHHAIMISEGRDERRHNNL